jgi:hypothetical protein
LHDLTVGEVQRGTDVASGLHVQALMAPGAYFDPEPERSTVLGLGLLLYLFIIFSYSSPLSNVDVIRLLKSKPLKLKLKVALFLLYPVTALLLAVALVVVLSLVIRTFRLKLDKILESIAASFLIVSLLSLIGDQEILNHVAGFIGVNPKDPYAKAALKYGKSINLVLTAMLQLIATIMMLVA